MDKKKARTVRRKRAINTSLSEDIMPQAGRDNYQEANRNNGLKAISGDYCPPENLQLLDGRIHVSARWLSARFKVAYTLICHVIAEIEQHSPVFHDGANLWIDDAAFIEICNYPSLENTFNEAERLAVLQLLGHYCDMGGEV